MTEYCKHCLPIYDLKDGTKFYSCVDCNPNTVNPNKKKKGSDLSKTIFGPFCTVDTVLWLSENASLQIEIPEWAEYSFFEKYFEIKNYYPEYGYNVYKNKAENQLDKIWFNMKVLFPSNDNLVFNPKLNITKFNNGYKISSNKFVWELLRLGFDFGNVESHNRIRIHLNIKKGKFDESFGKISLKNGNY